MCETIPEASVLTQIVQSMKVQGVLIEELHSLDLESLNDLRPVHGLIFFCEWRLPEEDKGPTLTMQDCSPKLYFSNQVLDNACAIQGILSVLMSCPDIDIGPEVSELKRFSMAFPPVMKGLTISKNEFICSVQNSFLQHELPTYSNRKNLNVVWSYVSYVAVDNIVYELDGMKGGPVCIGQFQGSSGSLEWLKLVSPLLQDRVEKYMEANIKFSVMAVIKDMKDFYTTSLRELENHRAKLLHQFSIMAGCSLESFERVQKSVREIDIELLMVQQHIRKEDEKMIRRKRENLVAKHNWEPFMYQFLKTLNKANKLDGLIRKVMEHRKK